MVYNNEMNKMLLKITEKNHLDLEIMEGFQGTVF